MAIKLKFDSANNVIWPTFVLASRNGRKLGAIPAYDIQLKDAMNSYSDLTFKVYKKENGVECAIWNQLKDFKLMYCREWDHWFEIKVDINETSELVKEVSAMSLGESELSQINLYNIEINTETDISRDDYVPTVLYKTKSPEASLLDRIMEKAPHYKIKHVDASIASIQRTFQFDAISIYDAFQEIAKEINCIFIIDSGTDDDGNIARSIRVYDLESYCVDCGKRDNFIDVCPECGSTNVLPGYGEDTSIFISTENLADNIEYTTDTGSVKNCFRLVAGDDLMTATLVNCNPNGSGYIWYISNEVKEDMSDELVDRLNEYDDRYEYYQNTHEISVNNSLLTKYNNLVSKYSIYSDTLESMQNKIKGYPALMNAYYDTIDFYLFLNSGLMPKAELEDTTASEQASKLTRSILSPVAVSDLDICSSATASSAVLSMAKTLIDSRYQVKVIDGTFEGTTWTGSFSVTNYSNEEDTAMTHNVTVTINDDYEEFVKQKLDKALTKTIDGSTGIVELFDMDKTAFTNEIKKYCLSRLMAFHDACQACLDILVEQGIANKSAYENQTPNLYEELYVPYYEKLQLLEEEIGLREIEIGVVVGTYDSDGDIASDGMQTFLEKERNSIQYELDFERFVGEKLWLEFAAYRREDTYQNDNYISDGLNNAELFENALDFIETAKKEIFKSATLQHSISATLKNLLVMKEFAPIVDYFEVGNWLRIKIDGSIYRLRLLDYKINFNDLKNLAITFSDVQLTSTGGRDVESILNQAASMATSYGSVSRQAEQGQNGNTKLANWVEKGLDITNTKIVSSVDNQNIIWDRHGMIFKKYDTVTDTYDDCQLKIINSTMAVTDDNWRTVKTAVGRYYYIDPISGKTKMAYGVNAEALVGSLILGEQLGIYNESGSLSFDENGFKITNGVNSFVIDPNNTKELLALSNSGGNILWVDANGMLHISGDGAGLDISANSAVADINTGLKVTNDNIAIEVSRAKSSEEELYARIDVTEDKIASTVEDAKNEMRSEIEQTADSIATEVKKEVAIVVSSSNVIRVDGINGYYFYIQYSANADGSNMTIVPEDDTKYTGICNTTSETAPTDPSEYVWVEISSSTGISGNAHSYLHVKYSDDGKSFSGNMLSTNISDWESGYYYGVNKYTGNEYICCPELIPVVPGAKYRIGCRRETEFELILSRYTSESTAIGSFLSTTNSENLTTVTIPDNVYFVRVSFQCKDTTMSFEKYKELFISNEFVPMLYPVESVGETLGDYIGTYVGDDQTDSTIFSLYNWKFIADIGKEFVEIRSGMSRIEQTSNEITLRVESLESGGVDVDGIKEDLMAELSIKADNITSTVSKSMSKYDTTGYTISAYGFDTPDVVGYKASDYNGKYYLNQSNGDLYYSNGTNWTKQKTLPLITEVLSSKIEQKPDSIGLSVSNGSTSSTIKLTVDGVEVASQTISMNGVVTFTNLNSRLSDSSTIIDGSRITTGEINADLIKTGTLNAGNVSMTGQFSVYNNTLNSRFIGGYMGYMSGNIEGVPTDGIALVGKDSHSCVIATDAGARMQAFETQLYVSQTNVGISGAQNINFGTDGLAVINIGKNGSGKRINLYGEVYVNGKKIS